MGSWLLVIAAVLAPLRCSGHGHMTYPPSSRHGGALALGGDCKASRGACYWFTNNQPIPGEPVLPSWIRSVNGNISDGTLDWSRLNPWRAPGTAPVLGSGCGVAGGGPVAYANGGTPPDGIAQGVDGLTLPKQTPTVWQRGTVQEVGNSVSANHAGGYSWRLCKADADVNEACFQHNVLKFVGDTQFIVFTDGNWSEIPRAMVDEATYPVGSQWARFPVPSCLGCNPADQCGSILAPEPGLNYGSAWNRQVNCNGACAGSGSSKARGTCPGATQFPEPMPGMSGFGKSIFRFSVVDQVMVPAGLEPGEYLLSWRWDCEQSDQVFQNCADIIITDDSANALESLVSNPNDNTDEYHAVGAAGCKDQLYENECQENKGDSDKGKDDGMGCYALGVEKCGTNVACKVVKMSDFGKDGGDICWDANGETDEKSPGKNIDGCSAMTEAECNSHSECSWTENKGRKYCAGSTPEGKAEPEPEPESEPETDPEPKPTGVPEVPPVTNSSTDPEDTVVPVMSGVAYAGIVGPISSTAFSVVIAVYF